MKESKSLTVAVVGGGWSTNVGNGFYNLGTLYILKKLFPKHRITLLPDQEGYWDFRNHKTPTFSLRFLDHIAPDYIVLHGCFLTAYFPTMWSKTFTRLRERGTKLLFISAGLETYTQYEIDICRSFLREFPPFVFSSRDSITFKSLHDLAEFAYDGIDTAYYVNDAFPPINLDLKKYIVCNFDKLPEPLISFSNSQTGQPSKSTEFDAIRSTSTFQFQERQWEIQFPSSQFWLSGKLGKFYKYFEAVLLPGRKIADHVGDYRILRTDHQSNPWFVRKMYRAPNSFAWDLPEPYLALYAQSSLTLSDRVHACVATLAYGNLAMLFSRSPRSLIIDRIGVKEIKNKPVRLDMDALLEEKDNMLKFLGGVPF